MGKILRNKELWPTFARSFVAILITILIVVVKRFAGELACGKEVEVGCITPIVSFPYPRSRLLVTCGGIISVQSWWKTREGYMAREVSRRSNE
jgi:hypothetical protein